MQEVVRIVVSRQALLWREWTVWLSLNCGADSRIYGPYPFGKHSNC